MKKYLSILAALAMLCSCQEEPVIDDGGGDGPGGGGGNNNQPGVELTLSASKMAFSSFCGEQVVEVSTNQQSWTADVAQESSEWLSIDTEDKTLKVSVTDNPGASERQGVVLVKAGGNTVTLTVTQDASGDNAADGEETKVEYTLTEGTRIAPKALAQYIKSVNQGAKTFVIDKNIPAELLPQKGRLIINTPTSVLPGGLLADVQTISEGADGYLVQYSDVTLGQLFESLDLNSEGLDIGGYVTGIEDAEGNPVEYTSTKAATSKHYHVDIGNIPSLDLPLGLSFTPQIGIDIWLKMQMTVGDGKLSSLNFKVDTDVTLGADIELAVDAPFDWYKKLLSIYVAAIPVGPVLLTPSIDIYGRIDGGGKLSLIASVSSTISSYAWLSYDELTKKPHGDLNCDPPEKVEGSFKAGTKLEASLAYGLGVGASVGIFGEFLSVGLTLDLQRKEKLSVFLDMDAWKNPSVGTLVGAGIEAAELESSIELGGTLHMSFLGYEPDPIHVTGFSFPLDKYKVFPPVNHDVLVLQESGDVYSFKTTVDGPSLFSGAQGATCGELVLYYRDYSNALNTPQIFHFDLDQAKIDALWKDRDHVQTIETKASGLTPGKKYDFHIAWLIGDTLIPIFTLPEVMAIKPKDLDALHQILSDIRSSASGRWEECNWDSNYLPVNKLKNVDFNWFQAESDSTWVDITIPQEWKTGGNLTINDHSSGNTLIWQLHILGDPPRSFNSISVLDKHCNGLWCNSETKSFVFRGMDPGNVTATDFWDVSGSPGIYQLGYSASVMIADDCPNLGAMKIFVPKGKTLNSLSIKNNKLRICELGGEGTITSDAIAAMSDAACIGRDLAISNSDMSSITIGDGPTSVDIAGVASVTVANASNIKRINTGKGVSSLSVVGCPVLYWLNAERSSEYLTSFHVSGLPSISYLYVYLQKASMVIPQVFLDMMYDGAVSGPDEGLSYNRRYEYEEKHGDDVLISPGEGWHLIKKRTETYETWDDDGNSYYKTDVLSTLWYYDNGCGFYFSGEPSRGYHGKTSPWPSGYWN